LKNVVSITGLSSVSALGSSPKEIWNHYLDDRSFLTQQVFNDSLEWVASLPEELRIEVEKLRENPQYREVDLSVLFAIYTARNAVKQAGWKEEADFGVNIGSSRGATSLFEKYHSEFLEKGKSSTLASPTTTLGNISSWVAHDLQTNGPTISHSITCSTALHALLNGIVWLESGMTDKFIAGGSEAALTSFTIAQMKALKIYSKGSLPYPCKALDLQKTKNTMVLGEGASVICIESGEKENAKARIEGIGYGTEALKHNISISADAKCFQKSMKMALGEVDPLEVDAIVMHAPGTIKGDESEKRAIEKVFCNNSPFLTTNKWKLGHTFGASGMLSLELGILMLQNNQAIPVPFIENQNLPKSINKVLINAVGFGGNAVSVLLGK